MSQYEADKIIQLLQFCSWKARTEMSHTGLMELTARLGNLPDGNEQAPNEKYLVDLLSDARTARKRDNFVTKRKSYIDLLLKYGEFESWNHWKDTFFGASEYVSTEAIDFSALPDLKIGVWMTDILTKPVNSILQTVKQSSACPVDILSCEEASPATYADQILKRLEEYTFIVWMIPVGWKDQPNQMTDPSWKQVMETKRIIPVWVNPDDSWQIKQPFIPALKKAEIISGIPGLLASLLFLQEKMGDSEGADETNSPDNSPKTPGIHNTNSGTNSGIFFQGNGTFNHNIQNIARNYTKQ